MEVGSSKNGDGSYSNKGFMNVVIGNEWWKNE
jgi:hypothetical protein